MMGGSLNYWLWKRMTGKCCTRLRRSLLLTNTLLGIRGPTLDPYHHWPLHSTRNLLNAKLIHNAEIVKLAIASVWAHAKSLGMIVRWPAATTDGCCSVF
jgi:hypothetical protein